MMKNNFLVNFPNNFWIFIQIFSTITLIFLFFFLIYGIWKLRQFRIFRVQTTKLICLLIFTKDSVLILFCIILNKIFPLIFPLIDVVFLLGLKILGKIQKKRLNCSWWGYKPKKNLRNSKKKSLPIGVLVFKNQYFRKFSLNIEEIKRHILIYGQTGTGKTSYIMYFLKVFAKKWSEIPFTLFEFKGEYHSLANYVPGLKIFEPGLNLSINIFDKDIFTRKNYAEVLFDSLKSCRILEVNADFSPQMERVLVDVLQEICQISKPKTWDLFYSLLDKAKSQYQEEIPQIATTIVSIKNRLRRFSSGPLSVVFNNSSSNIKISEILQNKAIINLGSILQLGGSKQDLIFFANLILKWVWETAMTRNPTDNLEHLTIFEDVSYIASSKLVSLSNVSLYLEDIALLLRGKGEGLVSISTSLDISKNVILNAGTKMFFKFNEKPDDILHHLSFDKDQVINIQDLPTGMCIVKTFRNVKPYLLYTYNVEKVNRKRKKNSKLRNINEKILHLKNPKQSSQFFKESENNGLNNSEFQNSEKDESKKSIDPKILLNLSRKIHEIENLIFQDDFQKAFDLILTSFDLIQQEISNDNRFSKWFVIEKKVKNFRAIAKKIKEQNVQIEDCLIGLKLLKIIRKNLDNSEIDTISTSSNTKLVSSPIKITCISLSTYLFSQNHELIKNFYSLGQNIALPIVISLLKDHSDISEGHFGMYGENFKKFSFFHRIRLINKEFEIFFLLVYPKQLRNKEIEEEISFCINQFSNKIFKPECDLLLGFFLPFLQISSFSKKLKGKTSIIKKNSRKNKRSICSNPKYNKKRE